MSALPGSAGESSAAKLVWTAEEAAWLKEHPVLRAGCDPAWPPFSFYTPEGVHAGVDADLLGILAARMGVKFDVVRTDSWRETDALGRAGKLDVICGMAETEERKEVYAFSDSYIGSPVAVIMRIDAPFYTGLRNLKGKEVAAPAAYVTTRMIEQRHPGIILKKTTTTAEAMHAVSRGQAEATVENLITASYLLREEGLTNLKIAGLAEFNFELRLAVPKDRPMLAGILDKALASISQEERFRLRDKWVPLNIEEAINWSVVKRVAGWFFLTAALVVSVVAIKNRRLARELEARRVAEIKLRELNEEKNHLMAMLAHDLKNPLQTIILACGGIEAEQDREAAEIIQQTADRMTRLVRNVLNANAWETGKAKMEIHRHDLAEVVEDVVTAARPKAEAKQIELSYAPGPGAVMVDSDALTQVVDNLVGNALKFTPSGGHVAVEVARDRGAVELKVSDSGPGIRAEERPKLFGKYSRLSAKPTGGESSHGLGLSIAKQLAETMGGTITVDAPGGRGATFRLRFPEAA